ncbi:tRNA(Ser) Um(44) 2'-O-methyltransferase [Saxophila tyrrhenica]|uniref:tRNA (uracil-O(2)-)-methyltransferase n=1 Tax=Saxophila tyrrhenica TaxID=1690608 RepID=A0AAV9PPZ6_9PEZI|nr:tRNA(Ser) Um(44) 2'-O-methyltransferase [Saxophila tyrrhenica]
MADESSHADELPSTGAKFTPRDRTSEPATPSLPDDLWVTVLDSPCTFGPDVFSEVMLNLIKNPNITASHLFRADILYDGDNGRRTGGEALLKQLKAEYQPIDVELPGFQRTRTIVRQLIPRNPQLDAPLTQTCHFFNQQGERDERNLVVYVPHVQRAEDVPFYHPAVSQLAFEHIWRRRPPEASPSEEGESLISISYWLCPSTSLTTKLSRTALRLLQTVHKHGQGHLTGYEKRVHHDQVVPQKRYQDTYARLKTKYGKQLAEQWVEVTDPGKHVFEDIGIAAFLIELWRDTYPFDGKNDVDGQDAGTDPKPRFPGFVDIGCGNGVLVHILLSEGYEGWGFDARERKTWSIFPEHVQRRLKRRIMVPDTFYPEARSEKATLLHNGIFEPGTFIISNHADELTAWTPLLAYLNRSSFIAIPCCSHDLSGARFRAPASTKAGKENAARLPQQSKPNGEVSDTGEQGTKQAAETGSLKRTEAQKKMPSAYSTLCSYVSSMSEDLGFDPEREVLRIPSTRNQCIIGRKHHQGHLEEDMETRGQKVVDVVEHELKRSVDTVGAEWIERAEKLARKPASGH